MHYYACYVIILVCVPVSCWLTLMILFDVQTNTSAALSSPALHNHHTTIAGALKCWSLICASGLRVGNRTATAAHVLRDLRTSERGGRDEEDVGVENRGPDENVERCMWVFRGKTLRRGCWQGLEDSTEEDEQQEFWVFHCCLENCDLPSEAGLECVVCIFRGWSYRCDCVLHCGTELSWTPAGSWFSAEQMEEICSSLFGPRALSDHTGQSTFIHGPAGKSTGLTIGTLLARNVYHIGGTLVVPKKCRLTQIGKLICLCVSVCPNTVTLCLKVKNPQSN